MSNSIVQTSAMKSPPHSRRSLAIELTLATLAILIATHVLFIARTSPIMGQALPAIAAVLLLYTPIVVLWRRGRPVDFLDHGWRSYARSFLVFVMAAIVIFPPFLAAAHGWQMIVVGKTHFQVVHLPNLISVLSFQLVLVALPEEFYFRGYFQSTIDLIFKKRIRILGAELGWGWIITAAVFALAHTIVTYQWWHFSIFFPALVFGFLRAKTGGVTAPVLFHAASNVLMDWMARSYV